MEDRILKATFDCKLEDISWAVIEEYENYSGDPEDIASMYIVTPLIRETKKYKIHETQITGKAQRVMAIIGRITGGGHDCLLSVECVQKNAQYNVTLKYDCAEGKAGDRFKCGFK